jgi:hypothetical protein
MLAMSYAISSYHKKRTTQSGTPTPLHTACTDSQHTHTHLHFITHPHLPWAARAKAQTQEHTPGH